MAFAYGVGATPGAWRYCCTHCGWGITIEPNQALPPCGQCDKGADTTYEPCKLDG
jgi:hypothetical protein